MVDTPKQQENQPKRKKYQKKKEKNKFEDIVKHKIYVCGLTKSPEENSKRILKETAPQIKALYNHYGLKFDPLVNGHKLAIHLAKEFIPGFLDPDYHIGRPKKDTFFWPLAICLAFEILQLEHFPEKVKITSLEKEVKKRWKVFNEIESLRVRYYDAKKTLV